MIACKDILGAKAVLELPDRASLAEIKSSYRRLVKRWHPDRCGEDDKEQCEEMTRKISQSYRILTAYCESYKYSFERKAIDSFLSDEEWWQERFGNDPLWERMEAK